MRRNVLNSVPNVEWERAVRHAWLLGLAASAIAFASAHAADTEILRLSAGSGSASVGVAPGSEDAEPGGPNALAIAPDGSILILDQLNGRILSVGGGRSGGPESIPLPGGLEPSDMALVRGSLYVFDGEPLKLQADPGGRSLVARSAGDDDIFARSVFAQTGSMPPGPIEEALGEAGRDAGRPTPVPVLQFVASSGLGDLVAEVTTSANEREVVVTLRRQGEDGSLGTFGIAVPDRLGSVEVLDADASGRAFVLVENVPDDWTRLPDVAVVRFTADGRPDLLFRVPDAEAGPAPRRPVAVSRNGEVFALKVDGNGASVVELEGLPVPASGVLPAQSTGNAGGRRATPAPRSVGPSRRPPGSADPAGLPLTAMRPMTRSRVVETAFGFETMKWLVTRNAYGPDPDMACDGFENRIRRPRFMQGRIGKVVQGMPYCWGCKVSPAQFAKRVNAGIKAGNVCTRRDPRRDVVGVDCSSFVSEAWGLAAHVTTRMMGTVSRVLSDPWSLRPGDALNKPGSHVVLFLRFMPDRKIEVLEASPGGCPGRVCRNVYPLGQFLARGYAPIRFRAIAD